MGKNKIKLTGFRIEDKAILDKLNIIAKEHQRSRNKEVEYALKQYVDQYEIENGNITIQTNNGIVINDIRDNATVNINN